MRLIVASNNAGKVSELRGLLPEYVDLLTLSDAGLKSPEETGTTFLENARLKALAAAQCADGAIADDSGLMVDALDGKPGVYSARFGGDHASDADNNAALLAALATVPDDARRARFVSCVVLAFNDGRQWHAEGSVAGRILASHRGVGGFGYDPLFEIDDPQAGTFNGQTMAELSQVEKNRISHRARAYRALLSKLNEQRIWLNGDRST